MESKGQQFSKFFVVILLMLFIFALGNLIFNLENLYLGEENVPEFIPGATEDGGNIATNQTLTNALRWVYFGFLGFVIITFIIGAASFGKSKDKKKWRGLFIQMASALLVCGVIVGFGYFYDDIEGSLNGGGESYLPDMGGGEVGIGNETGAPAAPDTAKVIATFGFFALIFAICALVFITLTRFVKDRSTKLDYSDMDLQTQEVANTIQKTMDALARGSDTRATVIRCYTDMCKVMAKHGVMEEEHLTPREFEEIAKENLPVPNELIHNLVVIFEEARYSTHPLTAEDSKRALFALEGMKDKLLEIKPKDTDVEILDTEISEVESNE
jgi:Domain of unknown function (DUF4129)